MEDFIETYKTYSNSILLRISENPKGFQPLAVEAAKKVLASRQLTKEDIDAARAELAFEEQKRKEAIDKKVKLFFRAVIGLSISLLVLFYLAEWINSGISLFIFMAAAIAGFTLVILLVVTPVLFVMTKNKKLIYSFFVALGILAIIFFQPVEHLIEKTKSPIVFSGYCEHTVTSVWFILREDKSFEYFPGTFIIKEMYYGKYQLNEDTLIFKFDAKPNYNLCDTLVYEEKGFYEVGDTLAHKHFFKTTKNKLHNLTEL